MYKLQKYIDMAHGTPRGLLGLAIVKKHWPEWEQQIIDFPLSRTEESAWRAKGCVGSAGSGGGGLATGLFVDALWRFGFLEQSPEKFEGRLTWKLECWLEDIFYMEAISYYNNGTGCEVGTTWREMFQDVEWTPVE